MTLLPPSQNLLIFDCETYFDKEYSLSKMPTPNYILDDKFELQMVAVKLNNTPHQIIPGPDFPAYLANIDPKVTTTVSFNSPFDNSILFWRYNWLPHRMVDAMGMARALWQHDLPDLRLSSVAQYLGLPPKGNALVAVMGMRYDEIRAGGLWDTFSQYALQDNFICEQVFLRALQYSKFPKSELELMDMVLRTTIEPSFKCNFDMLEQHHQDVVAAKQKLLEDANMVDRKIIMSTNKFKEFLESKGVEVAMKVSPTTGNETPAFARTDAFMDELQDHPDPEVSAAACARLAFKSTLEETRTAKFMSIAKLNWPAWVKGNIPMPLRYGAAHTHRLGGDWKMNCQNMPTVRGSKGKSKLRLSLEVEPDEMVITCDLSQIEARLAAWFCGCTTLVNEFAQNKDPYSQLATDIFGYPVNRKLKDAAGKVIFEIEGFIGKTGILGLGYGAGKDKFDSMVIASARTMKLDISGKYSRAIGDKAVETYRRRYSQIPQMWSVLNGYIATYWLSGSASVRVGPVEISYGCVKLPNGLALNYAQPRSQTNAETGRTEYIYRYGKEWHRLYGAKLLENIIQALARIVVMNAALRIRARTRKELGVEFKFKLQAHDELVYIVPHNLVDAVKKIVHEEMKRPPSWAPTAPIDAELGQGKSYGEAK
jgi:hypothetical protein